ncbi:hypothetical protein [Pseudonocardia sp. EV170527-09]|uniref:hypothetical protein n=1 Tax=Pseudonocardia sp. EV170527-09 TaxID=2603411 RepID=UPI001386DD2F|nr:hypothetical protein [Pseudonocardia sp. EV170527-09]
MNAVSPGKIALMSILAFAHRALARRARPGRASDLCYSCMRPVQFCACPPRAAC